VAALLASPCSSPHFHHHDDFAGLFFIDLMFMLLNYRG
jgi:hypothetical protein